MENKSAELEIKNNIAIITLHQHTLDKNMLQKLHSFLDQLEKTSGPFALITISSHQKIYSAGINFHIFQNDYNEIHNFLQYLSRFLSRFLQLPFPTISCINGHCLAAGFLLAMVHDIRICCDEEQIKLGMTEMNLGLTIPDPGIALLQAKLNNRILREICLFGKIINPQTALNFKIIDKMVKKNELLKSGIETAEKIAVLGESRLAYKGIKVNLYRNYIKRAESGQNDELAKKTLEEFIPKL